MRLDPRDFDGREHVNPLCHNAQPILSTSKKRFFFRVLLCLQQNWIKKRGSSYTCLSPHIQHTKVAIPFRNAVFRTIREPTLIRYDHFNSTFHLGYHSQCCMFYSFGEMCSEVHLPLCNYTEYFISLPKNPLPTVHSLATTHLLLMPQFCHFLEGHPVEMLIVFLHFLCIWGFDFPPSLFLVP